MTDPTAIQSTNPQGTADQISTYFQKDRLTNMLTLANEFFKSGCFGSDVKNTHQALVKIQTGLEMGMAPMESMNSLYIVNGRVNIYGSAMTKKLRKAGWTISDEYDDDANPKLCTVTVSKGDESYSYPSTLLELEKLNSQAAKKAPKDKLFWHGVVRIIRKYIPEVLDQGVVYLAEEAEFMEAAIETTAEEGLENFENKSDKKKTKAAKAKKTKKVEEAEIVETETVPVEKAEVPSSIVESKEALKGLFKGPDAKTKEEVEEDRTVDEDKKYEEAVEAMESKSGKDPEDEKEKPEQASVIPKEKTTRIARFKELQGEIRKEDPSFSYLDYIKEAFGKNYAYELTPEEAEKADQELSSLCRGS